MSKINILRIVFIIVLVCFVLPYASVSCSSYKIMDVNGYDLLIGGTYKVDSSSLGEMNKYLQPDAASGPSIDTSKKYGPQLMVILAFAAAILGLFITFIRSRKAILSSAIAAVAGLICTIGSIFTIRSWVTDNSAEAESIIKINYQIGFYLILIGFVAAAVFGFYIFYNKKLVQTPYFGQQGPYSPEGGPQAAPFINMQQQYAPPQYAQPQQQYTPPQQENINRFCAQCGSKMGPNDGFCSNCGAKVQ